MSQCMTHPDILDAERNGVPEPQEKIAYECIFCGGPIFEGDYFYDPPEGPLCADCDGKYMRAYHGGVA